jgi:hypothetical protein
MLTPIGFKNFAMVPTPFVEPGDLATPAKVVTLAVEMTI